MVHIMRLLAGLLFVLLMATLAVAQVQGEPVKPVPAWCGGSYSVTGGLAAKEYVEAAKAGLTISSGSNFGSCDDATYPAAPSSQVSFDAEGRALYQNGDVDKDGKAIVLELKRPEIPK